MRGERLPISVAAGALIVPLTAVLAVALVAPRTPSPDEAPTGEAEVVVAPVIQAPAGTAVQGHSLGADLAAACGPAGRELATVDSNGSATDVQRAALEALRPICAAVGMALPEDPAAIAAMVPSATTPAPDPVTVEAPAPPREDGEWEVEYEDGEWQVDD